MPGTPFSTELLAPALARAPHALPFLRTLVPHEPQNDEALLEHLVAASRAAYADVDYPCLVMFLHLQFGIAMHPAYALVEQLSASSSSSSSSSEEIALDVGCALGSDARWLAHHGWHGRAVGAELRPVLLEHGHRLFRDSPQSCGVRFLLGDLFDGAFLGGSSAAPDGSLTALQGRVRVLYAASLFHLFDAEAQQHLARHFGALLAPGTSEVPALVLGRQIALPTPGTWATADGVHASLNAGRWAHNEASFEELWRSALPDKHVKVQTTRQEFSEEEKQGAKHFRREDTFFLVWSVQLWDK